MKRKTLHENSFHVFSWFFTSSLGSNLPPPVVGSGITISWHRAAGQNLSSYIIMLLGWFITSFVTLTLITLLYWVLLPFSHTDINQPLFLGGHNCPHSLKLLHDTWSSVLTSANTQDLLIPHPWLVDLHPSLHHLSTPMAHIHISGTSSSFSKGKNIQVKCPLEGLSQYIHNIKHMVICFGELTTFLRHVISSTTPFR